MPLLDLVLSIRMSSLDLNSLWRQCLSLHLDQVQMKPWKKADIKKKWMWFIVWRQEANDLWHFQLRTWHFQKSPKKFQSHISIFPPISCWLQEKKTGKMHSREQWLSASTLDDYQKEVMWEFPKHQCTKVMQCRIPEPAGEALFK